MDKTPVKPSLWSCCHKLSLVGAVCCFVVLFLTGFSPIRSEGRMAGYPLMVHTVCSAVFVLCMAVLVLGRSQRHAFSGTDWKARRCLRLIAKTCYWLLLLLMLPLTLSIILSMFPWFGTHGLETSFHLHRYSAMTFSVTAVLYVIVWLLDGGKKTHSQ